MIRISQILIQSYTSKKLMSILFNRKAPEADFQGLGVTAWSF